MIDRIKKYWKTKSLFSKFSDIFFVLFVTAMLFPQGRLAIGGTINRVKAIFTQPSLNENAISVNKEDYNWELIDINKNEINFKESEGKVIFLNLWATWCPPCVGEMPEIQKLYDKFKNNENIRFYMVTSDSVDKMKAFVEKRGYSFPVYKYKSETPFPFKVRSIPTTFVISKSGEIVIKETGAANWGGDKMIEIINELLNK